jgi:hypothetical protein
MFRLLQLRSCVSNRSNARGTSPAGGHDSVGMKIPLLKHTSPTATRDSGSYEIGRPSRFYYWDDIPGRRLRPDLLTSEQALRDARSLAKSEQNKLEAAN